MAVFQRTESGILELIEVWRNPDENGNVEDHDEAGANAISKKDYDGGNEISVTPDGSAVWVLGTESDTVVRFARDSKTGKLTFIESHYAGRENDAAIGPSGLAFSADSRFCYVADEKETSLLVYERIKPGS